MFSMAFVRKGTPVSDPTSEALITVPCKNLQTGACQGFPAAKELV